MKKKVQIDEIGLNNIEKMDYFSKKFLAKKLKPTQNFYHTTNFVNKLLKKSESNSYFFNTFP